MKIDITEMASIELDTDHNSRVFRAALAYARQGIRIVPLVKNGKSLPPKDSGINYGSASSKAETVARWFDPESGKFAGHNIGIATGFSDGVFALDVDCEEGYDTNTEFDRLIKQHGDLDSPVAMTPRGGRHFLFRWSENASSSTSKVANGIDTRGGEANKSTGHIVAFPSSIDGRMYKWAKGGDVGPVPSWILDRLGASWGRSKSPQMSGAVEETVPEEQLNRMLSFIPIDDVDYEEWVKVGMAVKTQYPNDIGLRIWGEWSKKGSRHKRGECTARWEGFDPDGATRIGTIYYLASAGGWVPLPGDVLPFSKNTEIEMEVAKMNKKYAVVCVGKSVKVIMTTDMEKLDRRDRANGEYELHKMLDVDSFRVLASTEKVLVFEGDRLKQKNTCDIWLSHPSRRSYAHGTGFYPNSEPPEGKFNLWQGYSVDPVEGEPTMFINHIKDVVCDGDDDLFVWVLDWMADAVQDTLNPKGCAVIIRGTEGCGKGIFADAFGRLFGSHYKHLLDIGHLTGNFNAHLAGAVVVFADEVFWPGNRQAGNKFKGIVTEKKISMERKGVDVESMSNMIRVIVSSNEDWVIPAGPESRRWLVLDCNNSRLGDREYFDSLEQSMNHEGLSKLLFFLQNRTITSDLRKAPETRALRIQRNIEAEAHDPVFVWVRKSSSMGVIETPDANQQIDDSSTWPSKVSATMFHAEFFDWSTKMGYRGRDVKTGELFKMSLERLGFKRVKEESGYFYQVPEIEVLRKRFEGE